MHLFNWYITNKFVVIHFVKDENEELKTSSLSSQHYLINMLIQMRI